VVDVGGRLLVAVTGGAERVPPLAIAEPIEAATGPQHVLHGDVVFDAPIQDHRLEVEIDPAVLLHVSNETLLGEVGDSVLRAQEDALDRRPIRIG
jgi:hypothetical protein